MQALGGAWQIAVDEFGIRQALRQHGLAGAPHAGEPDDGRLPPGGLQALGPEWAVNHESGLYI